MSLFPKKRYLMSHYRSLRVQLESWLKWDGHHQSPAWKTYTRQEKIHAKWMVLKTILVGFPYYWIVSHYIHPGRLGEWLGGFQPWVVSTYLKYTGFNRKEDDPL